MNWAIILWLAVRATRWVAWIGFLLYGLHFMFWPDSHLDRFGRLLPTTEACLFGLGLLAIFAGFLKLAMREKTGLARPKFGQLIPPKANEGAKLAR